MAEAGDEGRAMTASALLSPLGAEAFLRTMTVRVARVIHDAQWEERFDNTAPDSIERAMAMKQAEAAIHEFRAAVSAWASVADLSPRASSAVTTDSEEGRAT